MKKHRFNIFPEMKPDDYARLRDDIKANGYDQAQPVVTYQREIIDGWNRQTACDEIGITPTYRTFEGTDSEAIAYVMRTNKRRNLNSGQWATVAVEAEDIMEAIRAEASKNKGGRPSKAEIWPCHHCGGSHPIGENPCHGWKPGQKIVPVKDEHKDKTATKAAELFNTNRTYVNQAAKMKDAAPEVFEKVKAGKMTMRDANKAVRAIPTEPWLDDEKERKAKVEKGQSVVANQQRDKSLIQWAEKKGLAVYIGRGSPFGNPFILDKDGGRDDVCESYAKHYLPFKPSINKVDLRGKVLVCHCYPERCHGESLAQLTEE